MGHLESFPERNKTRTKRKHITHKKIHNNSIHSNEKEEEGRIFHRVELNNNRLVLSLRIFVFFGLFLLEMIDNGDEPSLNFEPVS